MKRRRFLRSFKDAFSGLLTALYEERNLKLQIVIAIAVSVFIFLFPLSDLKRGVVLLTVFMVLAFELLNTSFERLSDLFSPEINAQIRKAKDIAAAGVLLAALGALLAGLLIIFGN